MRISIISPHFRGPRHRLENIAFSLQEKFKVSLFIFSSDVPKNARYKKGNAIFFYIKIPLIIRKLRLYYLFFIPIIILSAFKADILLTNEAYKTASIAGLISKILYRKLILFYGTLYFKELELHSRKVSSIPKKFKTKLYNLMELISVSTVDMIISPDRRVTKYFEKYSFRPKILNWFNMGVVDTEKFSFDTKIREEYREKLGIPNSDITLLFVGEISKIDGADIAIKVFEKIQHHYPNIWLVMIGSGPRNFIDALRIYISSKKLKNIIFTDHVPYSLIQNYMMVADLAILPYQEPNCGIGNVVVELMSLGIPILASNYSEIKKVIIDGRTGFIARNEEDFVRKIKLLIEDNCIRQKIGEKCREYALKNFSYHTFSEIWKYLLTLI